MTLVDANDINQGRKGPFQRRP